jgi:outer membrane receptor for ferric coprogen and ferric-rhodotorulic acid
VDFKVNKRFEVNSSLALTEQTVRSVQRNNTSATANNIGKDLRYAPETVGNVELKYRVNGQTIGSLEAQYVGAYWMNEDNTVKYDGHTLLHARLTHNVGPWEYWLSIRNLQDKKYAEFATRSFNNNSYNPGAPRTVQAGLRYTFGGKAK